MSKIENTETQAGTNAHRSKMKGVWTIIEDASRDRSYWVRTGTGFENRDGSYNLYLDALPTNGKLHMRDIEPRTPATTGN